MNPQPLRVGGALDGWAAREQWARLEYFSEVAGPEEHEQQVQVSCSEDGQYSGAPLLRQAVHMRWGSFARSLLKPDEHGGLRFYMSQEKLLRGPKFDAGDDGGGLSDSVAAVLLEDDFAVPPFVPWAEAGVSVNLWLAAHRTDSALHYDAYHNLLCVVRGAKTVRLYPPSATAALAPGALWGAAPHHATFDPEAPPEGQGQGPNDGYRSERERLRQQGYRATLARGDCLFIPEGWWHQVSSEPGTAAVNLWWLSAHALASRPPPAAAAADSAAADGVEGGDGGGSGSGVQVLWARLALRRLIEERTDEFVRAFVQERRVRAAAAHPEVSQITNSPKWLATRLHACPSSDEGVGAAAAEMAAASATELRAVLVSWAALAAGGEQNAEAFRKWWSVFVTCDSAEEGDTLTICGREESVQISAHCAARALEADPAPREGEGKEQRHRRGVAELGQLSDALGEGWSCPRFSSATIWAERLQERAQSLPRRAARELSDELLRGAGPGEVSAFQ